MNIRSLLLSSAAAASVLFGAASVQAQTPAQAPEGQTPPIFNPGAPGEPARVVSAAEAVELSRTGFVEADVRFMQHMIVHHAQAVEMVDLLETRGASETVRRLGERIAQSQAAEMALMQDWLASRDQPAAAADPHAGHHGHAQGPADPNVALMPGMLSPAPPSAPATASPASAVRAGQPRRGSRHDGRHAGPGP